MKIYGGGFGAFRLVNGSYSHDWKSITLNAPSQNFANVHILGKAKSYYPPEDGWFRHYAGTAEVTQDQLDEYFETNSR